MIPTGAGKSRSRSSMLGRLIALFFLFSIFFGASTPAATGEGSTYSLFECATLGIQNSFKLEIYDSKMRQDNARVKETLAKNNPDVSISGSSTYQKPEVFFGLPIVIPGFPPLRAVITPEWYHSYSLSLTKLITSFGKVEAAAKLQKIAIEQDAIQKDIERDSLLFKIAQGYYGLILSGQLLTIAEAQEREWGEQYKVTEALYRRGVVARYDLLRVELAMTQSHDLLQTSVKNLDVARENLRTLMGLPQGAQVRDVKKISLWNSEESHRLEFPLDRWQNVARENNPTLMLCIIARRQGEYALELAGLDNAPALSFKASYNRLTKTFIGEDWSWQNSVALSLPLSDGGERKAKMEQAIEIIRQAELTCADTERTVLWNVEQAYLELHDLLPKLDTAKKQVDVAQEGLRVAKVRYREGLSTLVEVLDAETSLRNAQVNQDKILCSYYTQMAAMSFAAGILQDDIFLLGRKP